MEKINLFKKPMTNYHIPQNTILKFRFYFKFLVANNRDVAKEIKDYYVDTMSKVLFSYFKSYSGRLAKLQYDEPTGENDLMGVDDTQPKGFFSSLGRQCPSGLSLLCGASPGRSHGTWPHFP